MFDQRIVMNVRYCYKFRNFLFIFNEDYVTLHNRHKFHLCRHLGCKSGGTCCLLSDWKNQHRWVSTHISLIYQTLTWTCCRLPNTENSTDKVSLRELSFKVQWEDNYIAIIKIFHWYLFDQSRVPSLQFTPMKMELSAVTKKMDISLFYFHICCDRNLQSYESSLLCYLQFY